MSTIFDVAKEAGVSKSTVSRVLNNEPGVKEATKARVMKAIKKLDYSPSYFAQGIRTGKTKTIALMVPEYTNVFYNEMFRGVEDIALQHGYMVLICNTERHANSEVEYIKELLKRSIDGIIYNTYDIREDFLQYLKEISDNVPVVFMNRVFRQNDDISYVVTDGFNSTRKAVHYLYSRGKRKIAYISNYRIISVTEDRYRGYLEGLRDCGLPVQDSFIYHVKHQKEPDYVKMGCEAAEYFAGLSEKPDAILAATDTFAIGCIQHFIKIGIRVPEDINIIGFDNISLSKLIQPSLSTVAQPIRQLGQKAAEIIISKINGISVDDKITYEGELIIRESTN